MISFGSFLPKLEAACVALAGVLATLTPATGVGQEHCVYIANSESGSVSVVSSRSSLVTCTIPVGTNPTEIAIARRRGLLFVSNRGSGTISAIEMATSRVSSTLSAGPLPTHLAVDDAEESLFATNQFLEGVGGSSLDRFHLDSGVRTSLVFFATEPTGLAIDSEGESLYVTEANRGMIQVVDTTTGAIADTISVGRGPFDIAISPGGRLAYVTDVLGDAVVTLDLATKKVESILSSILPFNLTVENDTLYVTAPAQGRLYIVGAKGEADVVQLGGAPWDVAAAPGGNVWVTDRQTDTVYMVDPRVGVVQNAVVVGRSPRGLIVSSECGACRACVGDCDQSDSVSVDELLVAIQIVLGTADVDSCLSIDVDRNEIVTIDELILGVQSVLNGCNRPDGASVGSHFPGSPDGLFAGPKIERRF